MAADAAAAGEPPNVTMATHNGNFQCDEALGIWMLRLLPEYKDASLVRTRDQEVLDSCHIVIDVGGSYNHDTLRYDHHQKGFFETFDTEPGKFEKAEDVEAGFCKTKLSACGLVYKHYGERVLNELYLKLKSEGKIFSEEATLEGDRLKAVYLKLYSQMIEGLDAIDNGIEASDDVRYREGTHLSERIARLNSRWNETKDKAVEDAKFETASAMAGQEFEEQFEFLVNSWLEARDIVETAVSERGQVDTSGKVVKFIHPGIRWLDHLYDMERKMELAGDDLIKFALIPESSAPDTRWRVRAVTEEGTLFTNRLSLPQTWCGLSGQALSDAAEIEGCIFAHSNGFVGANQTEEGALRMAQKALQGNVAAP